MKAFEEFLSRAAPSLIQDYVVPMLWQSSLLIVLVFLIDLLFRKRLRPAVRYGLWTVVLLKLLLPPSLALPTGPSWWLSSILPTSPLLTRAKPVLVQYGAGSTATEIAIPTTVPSKVEHLQFPREAWLALLAAGGSLILLGYTLLRCRQVSRSSRQAQEAPAQLQKLLLETCADLHFPGSVRLKLTENSASPVVFGFFRPVILLPRALALGLTEPRLRCVFLHELIHIRRGDVWVNCAQTLLQIVYWWHPLVWLANSRLRGVREEAVDEAVTCALGADADAYPETLLEVAKLTLNKRLSALALLGIFESRPALQRRIERLLQSPQPARANLTITSLMAIFAFSAVALPMGQHSAPLSPSAINLSKESGSWPDPRFPGYAEVDLAAYFSIVNSASLELFLPAIASQQNPIVVSSNELAELERKLGQAGAQTFPHDQAMTFGQFIGGRFHYLIGGGTNNSVDYQTRTLSPGHTVVTGAECSYQIPRRPDWEPLEFTITPWAERAGTGCEVELGLRNSGMRRERTQVTIPAGGAMLWIAPAGHNPNLSELVLVEEGKPHPGQGFAGGVSPEPDPEQKALLETLVQNAKVLLGSGKLDQAEISIRQALAIDPRSNKAYYYLNLINDARVRLLQSRDVRLVHPGGTNISPNLYGVREILDRLVAISLEKFSVDHLTLDQVLENLNQQVQMADKALPQISLRLKPSPVESENLGKTEITILPALTDVTLKDVIEVIVRISPQPITYSVEDSTVVISPAPLYSRLIRINTKNLADRLRDLAGEKDVATPAARLKALREFFAANGADLRAPKSIFLNEAEGSLLVHAALRDLGVVEPLVSELNLPPPQLNLKVKFLTVPGKSAAQIWKKLGMVKVGATNTCKILTPSQTADLLRSILKTPGGDLVNEAGVTTLSGRQTQVQCVNVQTVISNGVPAQLATGPQIDLIGSFSSDLWRLDLTAAASLTEFLGYEKSKSPTNTPLEVPPGRLLALPKIKVRQITARNTVPDGYTLVMADSGRSKESQYIVMVTPTLLDGTGRRMHNDAEIETLMR